MTLRSLRAEIAEIRRRLGASRQRCTCGCVAIHEIRRLTSEEELILAENLRCVASGVPHVGYSSIMIAATLEAGLHSEAETD